MTGKHIREMDAAEQAETLARLKKGPPPEPMPPPDDRRAQDMTAAERRQWISEHIRRSR